jgi:deferrochelatase/peroxidase EfeB
LTEATNVLDRALIQSEVLCGNFHSEKGSGIRHGAYLVLAFKRRKEAREFLGKIPVTSAAAWTREDVSLNLGFTFEGMAFLLDPALGDMAEVKAVLDSVGAPFVELSETMAARAEVLGDTAASAPKHWDPSWKTCHAIVIITGPERARVHQKLEELEAGARSAGAETTVHWGNELDGQREHFGYVDGISQPAIAGETHAGDAGYGTVDKDGNWRGIQPGELVLGYDDEDAPFDGSSFLENATFFVLRKLEQDVDRFHDYLDKLAERDDVKSAARETSPKAWAASRIMGRHFDGDPLLPKNGGAKHQNDFRYAEDHTGFGCPFGAHIRRANPRDVAGRISDRSERHRIVRRSLMYAEENGSYALEEESFGHRRRLEPQSSPPMVEGLKRKRGMLFGCFNASIGRQFEVVQGGWLNGGESAPGRLFTLRDPIAGANHAGRGDFVVPGRPLVVLPDVELFTITRGGAYFFIPGLVALELLRDTPAGSPRPKGVPATADAIRAFIQHPQARRTPAKGTLRRLVSHQAIDLSLPTERRPGLLSLLPRLGSATTKKGEEGVFAFLSPIAVGQRRRVEAMLASRKKLDKALDALRADGAPLIHHARFSIVDKLRSFPPIEGAGPPQPVDEALSPDGDAALFFACWFDGKRETFLEGLTQQAGALPFIHCEGWPQPGWKDWVRPNRTARFFEERELSTLFAYRAYPNSTKEVRHALQIRETFINVIAGFAGGSGATTVKELFDLVADALKRSSRSGGQASVLDAKRSR